MPGPFTHIYAARRVAEFLSPEDPSVSNINNQFIRPEDPGLGVGQELDPALVALLGPKECGDVMKKWAKFTAVGSTGPDLFFFLQDYNDSSMPCDEIMLAMSLLYYLDDQSLLEDPFQGLLLILAEVNDTWASNLRFIIKLDQIWKEFLTVWNATIGPILDQAGQLFDVLTGRLYSALGDAVTALKDDLLLLAEEELLTQGDIFGWFSLKMRKGFDEKAFLWSDMMHYRRTTAVPDRLISHARRMLQSSDDLTREHGEQLLAFGLGWVCHVGTDVIGHSFVNEQCGGPFRTHWQRHHLVENHIDAWNYQCTGNGTLDADDFVGFQESYPSLAESALYFAVQIPQDIDDPNNTDKQGKLRQPLPEGLTQAEREKRLDTDGTLPLWLAEMIVQVFIEVYAAPTEGGDQAFQNSLNEGSVPHPLNLMGHKFQDALHINPLITNWLGILSSGNPRLKKWLLGQATVVTAIDDLRKAIAPDPPILVPDGFPLPWEVMATYRFMLSWFKRQYMATMTMDRPEPPTIFTPPASNYNFGPPNFSGVNPTDPPLSQTCEALAALLDWVFKGLGAVALNLYGIANLSELTFPLREWIYDEVTLPTWQSAENIRMVLVHLGYMMPQSYAVYANGDLRRPSEIDDQLINLGHTVNSAFEQALAAAADPLGNLDKDPTLTNAGVRDVLNALNPWLPVRVTKGQKPPQLLINLNPEDDVVEYQRPWGFPNQTNDRDPAIDGNYLETPLTVAGPYPTSTMPHTILQTGSPTITPISNTGRGQYELADSPARTDELTNGYVLHDPKSKVEKAIEYAVTGGTNPLGDPVIFSIYLIGQIANNPKFLSNFNLDADRGYGYLCWDWDRNAIALKDDRDHEYMSPVELPEGAKGWTLPDPKPLGANKYDKQLKLHYPGH
jgi:hypothetical protein